MSNLYESKQYENIREVMYDAFEKFPENVAFTIKHKKGKNVEYENITYKDLKEQMNALGTALIELGLKDKRVAIIGKNRYEWSLGYLAVLNGVGILIPLDKGLPEQEIIDSLKRSKADCIIFEDSYSEMIERLKENNTTNVKHFICMDTVENKNFIKLEDLISKGKVLLENGDKSYLESEIDAEKMSIILFTSGTTSLSKAVALSHKNIASNIYGLNAAEKLYSTDVNFCLLPFHHTFGSTALLLMLNNGVKNVFCDGLRHIQENLVEYKVSVFVAVPLILESMHKKIMHEVEKQGKTKLIRFAQKISNFLLKFHIDIRRKLFKQIIDKLGGNLRFVVSGAAGIDRKVGSDLNSFGILTVQGYGLTETSPVLSAETAYDIRNSSVGFPLCNVEMKIDNPNEEGIGEIIAKGPNVMLGYYENKEATDEILIDDWFHTGDLGYKDKDGFFFVTGRKKNVIVLKNGKNIYPEELELLINNLPYVAESMVFGWPTDDGDLLLSVKIVYNKDYIEKEYKNISKEELEKIIWKDIKEINTTLTNYKHIKKLIITDEEMIKTTTAKVKRFQEIEKITKNAKA